MPTQATEPLHDEPTTGSNSDEAVLDIRVEALVFSSNRPVSPARLAEALPAQAGRAVTPSEIEASIVRLNGVYEQTGRSFRVEHVAGGYRVMTRPELADVLAAFHRAQASSRLSRAAIETLAIVAYQQPVTRARLEAIRGVGCGEVLRSLLERRLVAVTGRAEELGRPMLYGTTRHFLDTFGMNSIKELPDPAANPEPPADAPPGQGPGSAASLPGEPR
ncbi:MAG: SMC-Scp complex subunit ScpB [Phycisphaeraceae bacterium]|nr:MAG: SMC-Scp complex subunit ScpB [Phycisphaeraceae bacterium]